MTSKDLPAEIWSKVVAYVRRPLPTPTGNNPRSSIRQPGLATLMRVSKFMNNVSAPHLYSVVITDHLPSFLYGTDNPAAAEGIDSKGQNLRQLILLFLEYHDKDGVPFLQPYSTFKDTASGRSCRAEVAWTSDGLRRLAAHLSGTGAPQLQTLSLCAFLDNQAEHWWIAGMPVSNNTVDSELHPLSRFVAQTRVRKVCQRAETGPLSGPDWIRDRHNTDDDKLLWNTHHPVPCRDYRVTCRDYRSPAVLGGEIKWYFEDLPLRSAFSYHFMADTLKAAYISREKFCAGQHQSGSEPVDTALDIRMFMPAKLITDARSPNARSCDDVLEIVHHAAWKWSGGSTDGSHHGRATKDKRRVSLLEDAPSCESCGWTYADMREA